MPWAAAIALGAIVAPPDAAAATAVLRQVRLPHRILTILEGESLLNDASALLIYRGAVTAAAATTFSFTHAAPAALASVIGSLILGPVLALVWLRAMATLRGADAPTNIILQFIGTFGIWLLADRLGLSGVLTIVSYAITLARQSPEALPARLRVPSYAVWETTVFVLNVLAFVLIGLQLGPIVEHLQEEQRITYMGVAAAVLATVILVRIAWVMSYNAAARWHIRHYGFHPPRPMSPPTVKSGILISWCGMRGIVTLATALALPDGDGGAAFPYRDLIVFTAFAVVFGTLVLQGLTLRPLLMRLNLRDDDPVAREVERARKVAYTAAIAALDGEGSPLAEAIRAELQASLARSNDATASQARTIPSPGPRVVAVSAARQALLQMRSSGEIGDDAFHQLEAEMDRLELSAT
jgi:CPA1 family monovalent cation:H+ antiporter